MSDHQGLLSPSCLGVSVYVKLGTQCCTNITGSTYTCASVIYTYRKLTTSDYIIYLTKKHLPLLQFLPVIAHLPSVLVNRGSMSATSPGKKTQPVLLINNTNQVSHIPAFVIT